MQSSSGWRWPGWRRNIGARPSCWGWAAAVILRILFSIVALSLLEILGLTLAGGVLLVWVAYKLYRELRSGGGDEAAHGGKPARKTLSAAVWAILLADVSMSLDNALAVAGAAHNNIKILVAGLVLSVALMAVAADWVAAPDRQASLAWLCRGSAVVAYVAIDMVVRGTREVFHGPVIPFDTQPPDAAAPPQPIPTSELLIRIVGTWPDDHMSVGELIDGIGGRAFSIIMLLLTVPSRSPARRGCPRHSAFPAAGDGATLPRPAGAVAALLHPQAPLFPRRAAEDAEADQAGAG